MINFILSENEMRACGALFDRTHAIDHSGASFFGHLGTTHTNAKTRVVVNINFFDGRQ